MKHIVCETEAVPRAWGRDGALQTFPGAVSSSEVSDMTAQKRLLESYGLGPSDKEAVTVNFLSRLSTQSVNNEFMAVPTFSHPGLGSRDWPTVRDVPDPYLPPCSLQAAIAAIGEDRTEKQTEAKAAPSQKAGTKSPSDSGKSNSDTSYDKLAILAAATAAIDSIVDTIKAALALSDNTYREREQGLSAAAIRRRDKRRMKQFEKSSFNLNSRSKKIRR